MTDQSCRSAFGGANSIWVTDHFSLEDGRYPYQASLEAGSDHSAVIADVRLDAR